MSATSTSPPTVPRSGPAVTVNVYDGPGALGASSPTRFSLPVPTGTAAIDRAQFAYLAFGGIAGDASESITASGAAIAGQGDIPADPFNGHRSAVEGRLTPGVDIDAAAVALSREDQRLDLVIDPGPQSIDLAAFVVLTQRSS